jgi:hypothetical protein
MRHLSPSTFSHPTGLLAALGLLLATAGAARAQTPASFAPVSTYSSGPGSGPTDVAVADVNGDGRPDLVTANFDNSTASVLFGQGAGVFSLARTFSTGAGSGPHNVVLADVNGDGRPDVITSNYNNTVGVSMGQAGGTFATPAIYSVGGLRPAGLAVADLNGDGWLDIVTANQISDAVGVLFGQAGGRFSAAIAYPTGTGSMPVDVAVADLNRDGRPDIVTVNVNTNTASVLRGQAGGGFAAPSTYPVGAGLAGLAVADMDGDGWPDIVTSSQGGDAVGILLSQAGSTFASPATTSTGTYSGPVDVVVRDVNGDAKPDIVTANIDGRTAGVLLGQVGGGFLTASAFPAGTTSRPQGVAVADVDGDGRPDIITANSGSSTVGVLLNTGTFTPLAAAPGAAAAEVSLFPNPARDGFAVQLPAAWAAAPVRAELRNALGQVVAVRTAVAGAAPLAFATAGLAPGVYGLQVQAGPHTLARRVVVE